MYSLPRFYINILSFLLSHIIYSFLSIHQFFGSRLQSNSSVTQDKTLLIILLCEQSFVTSPWHQGL